ncbi:MAG: NAD+ synthase [Gemmatimonadetes bacterium]|nr:NAD+ synthase [Gemmatimonadota bacterium]
MKIALAQINPTVGDIEGNTGKIISTIEEAEQAGADIVLAPELAVVGYPPKDLLLKESFVRDNLAALERIAGRTQRVTAIVGYVQPTGLERGKGLYNAAAICQEGKVAAWCAKTLLPTYDVFDESRYFDENERPEVVRIRIGGADKRLGVSICEDLWSEDRHFARRLYGRDPIAQMVDGGADLILNIGASPYSVGKHQTRLKLFAAQARRHRLTVVWVNQVGGNDDLIFDGASGAFDAKGNLIAHARSFCEDFLVLDLAGTDNRVETIPEGVESIHQGLVLGTRDYVSKCGFKEVVIGVSGGIDSAVTAAIAVAALGAECVHLVAMPSRYSSEHSRTDAEALAHTLGTPLQTISIEQMHRCAENELVPHFDGRPPDITEENIQARLRGTVLMALSNKFGWLLLTTGNKSELAVGYCTLYGDMCGGLAVLSDVPKTMVYELANHINRQAGQTIIPESTIKKPPSAELKEDQTDQDSLPPYDVLDAILERYIEQEQSVDRIVSAGFDEAVVRDVVRRVDLNEYKRKQAAVGLKVTSRAFGTGRRMPIAARYQ